MPQPLFRTVSISNLQAYLTKLDYGGLIFGQNSTGYNERRLVHNGLCEDIYPEFVAIPRSTKDVAILVKVSSILHLPLSVRSGGHSYTCTSTKAGKF